MPRTTEERATAMIQWWDTAKEYLDTLIHEAYASGFWDDVEDWVWMFPDRLKIMAERNFNCDERNTI